MKFKLFFLTILSINCLTNIAYADAELDQENVGSENIQEIAKRSPFSFQTHYDHTGKAKIKNTFEKGNHIVFAEANVEAGGVFYYNECYSEGLRLGLGFEATHIGFESNPYFNQDNFETLSVNLSGFTKRVKNWFWRSQLSANIDTCEWSTNYTSYDILLWGRYTFSNPIGVHIGLWAQTGLNMNYVYPIIGFDWEISKRWKLNLVFPMNMSLQYTINKQWVLALAGRAFDSRYRVHKKISSFKDLVHYQNAGAEFMVMYDSNGMTANVHVGMTLGGRYRIANKNNHHATNYRLDPVGYAGGEIDVSF
ncbi:MAG: DUF6268 family outer membrane beta-barrel protein [Parachlamydiaceae bacterium]|nr:DUF6268 family outer membrane beta-barrel protein [Parachlamydiaceae bacterium]